MKKIAVFLMCFVMLLCTACAESKPAEVAPEGGEKTEPIAVEPQETPAPEQNEPESAAEAEPAAEATPEPETELPTEAPATPYTPDLSALPIEYRIDWDRKEGTMFTYDIDFDGEAEKITYRLDEKENATYILVDDESIAFPGSCVLDRVILVDLDPETPWVNLLAVIDMASDDYITTEVHSENGAFVKGVEKEFISLSSDGRLYSHERTDLLGTKDGVRSVSGEKLEPDSEWLEVYTPSEEDLKTNRDVLIELGTLLHLKRTVNCRIDGKPTTLKKGSYVYMTRFHESRMIVEVRTEDGRTALISVDYDPNEYSYLIGGRDQNKVFDNIFYAD